LKQRIEAKKQALVVMMYLPNDDDTHIKDKVLDNLDQAELWKDSGMKTHIKYLDQELSKDDLTACVEAYKAFVTYEKSSNITMHDDISEFDCII
jgi:hypothetical protein